MMYGLPTVATMVCSPGAAEKRTCNQIAADPGPTDFRKSRRENSVGLILFSLVDFPLKYPGREVTLQSHFDAQGRGTDRLEGHFIVFVLNCTRS